MRNTYWFAVDYNGTGHLFTCPPERDTGMWTGEEALYIPKGQFGEMFPRITWQDAPVVVTLEVLPCVETRRLRLVKRCLHLLRGIPAGISQRIWRIHNNSPDGRCIKKVEAISWI
ncbi:MAG: hypothetical protein ACLUGY_25875 [Phocaeicola massiliensis]